MPLAIAHFSVSIIGRGTGRSAVLSAAYRHCARMTFEREAKAADYRAKKGLLHEEFVLPPDAPGWARDMVSDSPPSKASEAFWNAVENFEKRNDAQLAKDLTIALPMELSASQNIELVRDFVRQHILSRGMVADWVYHDAPGNPHIHLMMTLRPLAETGFGPKKVALLSADGQPLRTPAGKIVYGLWAGDASDFAEFRDAWFNRLNHHLALNGLDLRVDGRSYTKQGIDLLPTSHLGVGAKAVERKASFKGVKPSLERREFLEQQRSENRRRIHRRPETVVDLIVSEKSVFDQRDVAKVLHRYIDDPNLFQQMLTRILASPRLLQLQGETIAIGSGERLPARYTTRELIRLEAEMVSRANWLSRQAGRSVSEVVLERAYLRHPQLSDEQRCALEHVTGSSRIAAVVGLAGAGKTTMMRAAREAWEAAGYHVVGAALAGKAAEGLEKEAGIPSRTLASWQLLWKRGADRLDQRTVFVLDEAGMVGSKEMASVVASAVETGAKLVLVGDPGQLQPIGAGAAFRAIVGRIGYVELETIYRQREGWMREASLCLARGKVEEAISSYRSHGAVLGSELKEQAIGSLIADWSREYDSRKSTLILAHLRRDVRVLNELARGKLVERGLVGAGHVFNTSTGLRNFDIGDQIVFLRNDSALGVKNGMLGRVVEAAPGRIVAAVGEGESARRIAAEHLSYRDVDHGYAMTVHKSQGATVDRVKVLASLSLDRNLTYVAMTRHREDMKLYYSRRSFALQDGLSKVLARQNAKETTLDYEGRGRYRHALSFAQNRGLDIVVAARTILRCNLDWALRQRQRLAELGTALRRTGARLGLMPAMTHQASPKDQPMVPGVKLHAVTLDDAVEQKLLHDQVLTRGWQEITRRLSYVFVDAGAALHAMQFKEVVAGTAKRMPMLDRLVASPASIGPLKGKTGVLSSKISRMERQLALANVEPLKRDIDRYLDMRGLAVVQARTDEEVRRQQMSVDIPALSEGAVNALYRAQEAIGQNDLSTARDCAMGDPATSLEIERFNRAVSLRFGERTLLTKAALTPEDGQFNQFARELGDKDKQRLREAWPLMRTAQQLAAYERKTAKHNWTEDLVHQHRRSPVVRQ